jgi:chromosome transmission fidelity protein 1
VKSHANEPDPILKETRIIFCSRTHSQLTQFVKELRRVKPPPSITSLDEQDMDKPSTLRDEEIVKHLSLGSRKNLCINPKVSRLDSLPAINETCLDLQKSGIPEEQKCFFLPKKESVDRIDSFRDRALAEIHDIEDLNNLGRSMGVCPYYASRAGIESSEILTLPYSLLLQKSAREALGVSVKDHVVIIDEAHNLMDAIANTYSCSISIDQLETATSQVMVYVQTFKNRLKGKNRMYVTQIIRLLNSISDCLRSVACNTHGNEASLTPAQLLAGKGVDQIQPHKLIRYLEESKLAHKVEDYVHSTDETSKAGTSKPCGRGALQLFQSFLMVLTNPSAEGRFFLSTDEEDHAQVRYALLDPREHFRDIVEEARAVILAGGTMSPMSDYKDYLFSYLPPDRLKTFSFGHVVPPENLFAQSISTGPSGVDFDFTFEKRKSETMIAELGKLFINACAVIPDGVVAFFPSYDFLGHVVTIWKKTPLPLTSTGQESSSPQSPTTIFSALNALKPIFHETKANTKKPLPKNSPQSQPQPSDLNNTAQNQESPIPPNQESLLQTYTRTVDQSAKSATTDRNPSAKSGALLLSVINGSLSEGINFSDALARAVFAIGLPYPNPHSAVWKAKIAHVEQMHLRHQNNDSSSSSSNDNKNQTTHSALEPAPSPSSNQPLTTTTKAPFPSTQAPPPPPPPATTAAAAAAAKQAGREFYENATLRSVNQAIGRAIRHRADYAAILLVDRRYENGRVRDKLPGWIRAAMEGRRREGEEGLGGDGDGGRRRMNKKKKKQMSWDEIEEGLVGFFEDKA